MNQIATQASLEIDQLVGTWFNTNRSSPTLARVEITPDTAGLQIRVQGNDEVGTQDWGSASIALHASGAGSNEIAGFEAQFTTGQIERRVAANIKRGVLVIQCYSKPTDSTEAGSFTREFFHQRSDTVNQESVKNFESSTTSLTFMKAADRCETVADSSSRGSIVDLNPHLGIWRNTHQGTQAISHLELLGNGDGYQLHAVGVNAPRDWGITPVLPFAENAASNKASGFFADYDFEFLALQLAANFNKGLLIVACYTRFQPGDPRANYFTREFFYHEQHSG